MPTRRATLELRQQVGDGPVRRSRTRDEVTDDLMGHLRIDGRAGPHEEVDHRRAEVPWAAAAVAPGE
jgi:hypothetical protein